MRFAPRQRLLIAALALGGMGIASYLSYAHATDTALMCPTSGCGRVQQSSYAELVGVPVAYLGVVGYALILLAAVSARRVAIRTCAVLAVGGASFALYLLVIQVAVIDAVCTWCVASDVVCSSSQCSRSLAAAAVAVKRVPERTLRRLVVMAASLAPMQAAPPS